MRIIDNRRVYGQWAGNPKGYPERTEDCVYEVWDRFSWGGRQCTRKRGFGIEGLYCKQHAKMARNEEPK